jgi:hypothetical protein
MAVILSLVAAMATGWAGPAGAALTWDQNGATDGQTDGAGVWLTANQWWTGYGNQTWASGSDAIFGNGGAGGAVTLASPTTVNSLTFNSFTGTYTLGTSTQAITLNSGILKNSRLGRRHDHQPGHPWRGPELDEQFKHLAHRGNRRGDQRRLPADR